MAREHPNPEASHQEQMEWAAQEQSLDRDRIEADRDLELARIGNEKFGDFLSWLARTVIGSVILAVYSWAYLGITADMIKDPSLLEKVESFALWVAIPGVLITVYIFPRLFGKRKNEQDND